jgi:hypothetical protein
MLASRRMTEMAAPPRASTAIAKTPRASSVKKTAAQRAAASEAIPRKPAPPPAHDSLEAARMLHELRVNGQALSTQIARLAQRFL